MLVFLFMIKPVIEPRAFHMLHKYSLYLSHNDREIARWWGLKESETNTAMSLLGICILYFCLSLCTTVHHVPSHPD